MSKQTNFLSCTVEVKMQMTNYSLCLMVRKYLAIYNTSYNTIYPFTFYNHFSLKKILFKVYWVWCFEILILLEG